MRNKIACAVILGIICIACSVLLQASGKVLREPDVQVTAIKGKSYWRISENGKAILLSPKRDGNRVLHPSEELKMGKGGSLRIRQYGRIIELERPDSWYPIPRALTKRERAVSDKFEEAGRRAGRNRGGNELGDGFAHVNSILALYADCSPTVGVDALSAEYMQRALNSLRNGGTNSGVKIGIRIMNVDFDTSSGLVKRVLGPRTRQPSTGEIVIHENEKVMLELTNLGSEDCQVAVFDLLSNGSFDLIWPDNTDTVASVGATSSSVIHRHGKPVVLGRDTDANWDRRSSVIWIRGSDVLETFKVIACSTRYAGTTDVEIPRSEWSTASVTFRVVPAK